MSGARVLVVEDNATARASMRSILQADGYSVLEAEDGAGALRIASEQQPELVLLDCQLPDMDGFEVGRRLRSLQPSLPIVAVTGWAQANGNRVLTGGFSDLLVKPVESSRLLETVEYYLAAKSRQSSNPSRTVLLVDDDPVQRKFAELVLANAGFAVQVAEGGEVGLGLARERTPDVIVSDVLMPGMDGFALCRAARKDPQLAHVPIVLVSAHYVENEDRELAARFGASRYVSRTGGFDAVVRAVTDVMDSPVPALVEPPADELRAEYLRRVAHQLERQATIGMRLAHRLSLQGSALSLLDSLSNSLARQLDPESALDDLLAQCLNAAGISLGAIFLHTESGELRVKAQIGSKPELDWAKYSEVLSCALLGDRLMIPSPSAPALGDELLIALGAASALLLPITARGEALGVLLLASSGSDFAGTEGEFALLAARVVSVQLGQALALGRLFSKLMSAEQRYRALLEHAHDAVTISTPGGVILEVNRRTEELLRLPREQVVGRHLVDFAAKGRADSLLSAYDRVVAEGTGSIPPLPIERPDGSVAQVEFSSTVVEVGEERLVLSIGRDVTSRLRLEEQLRQSQKMEAIGRLAGGIAHDFNNVLSVILTYGEMLLSELPPGDRTRDDIEQIYKAGTRGAGFTRQLLTFSRQQLIEPQVLDLNGVLMEMDGMLQRILGADVNLVSLPKARLGRVRVDRGSIEQVIMNLVVNARDAMPAGGKLTIETENVLLDADYALEHHGVAPGAYVMLAITDSGVGMSRATQARIFEPFYTTKGVGKGTGLGLSTVFGVLQQSGGSVWVYSEMGQGTTFKVYLPRVDAEISSIAPAPRRMGARGTETVLLVEDDDQVREVARAILHGQGYEVLVARNAGEALLHCEKHAGPIHLLLTDVVMPQMAGPELAKRLTNSRSQMRVLCMSGYTDDTIVRHGVLESQLAYIQKPLTPTALASKVREVLDA